MEYYFNYRVSPITVVVHMELKEDGG